MSNILDFSNNKRFIIINTYLPLDAEIQRSTQKDQEHDTAITNINNSITNINNSITNIKGDITTIKQDVQDNTDDIDSLEAWKGQFPWGIKSCTCSGGGGGGSGGDWDEERIKKIEKWIEDYTSNRPGMIELFVTNPNNEKEFYIQFSNDFKMLCVYVSFDYDGNNTFDSIEGKMLGQENDIRRDWMKGTDLDTGEPIEFTGFKNDNTYITFPASDEHGLIAYKTDIPLVETEDVHINSIDQQSLWYARAYTATSIVWSAFGLETYEGNIRAYPMYNGMYVFCLGY